METETVQDAGILSHEFVQRWSRRLLRAYGFWVIMNLIAYVVLLFVASKGTFPGGLDRMLAVGMVSLLVSGVLLLVISVINAFALGGMWKLRFPRMSEVVRGLWYLSFLVPYLQAWGYLGICWKGLKLRWLWLALQLAGTVGIVGMMRQMNQQTGLRICDCVGFLAAFYGLTLIVQGRMFWVLGQVHLTRMGYRLVMSIVGLMLIAFFMPPVLIAQADRRLDWVTGELESMGIPPTAEAAEKAYFQENEANGDWSGLARSYEKAGIWNGHQAGEKAQPGSVAVVRMLKRYDDLARGTARAEEVGREFPEASEPVQWLLKLVDQNRLLRVDRTYSGKSLVAMEHPELGLSLAMAQCFKARGSEAVRQGNLSLAEAYWHRCVKLSQTLTATPDALGVAMTAVSVEERALELARVVVTSGRLSAAELDRWESMLARRQAAYFPGFANALKGEAMFMLNLAHGGVPDFPQGDLRNWAGAPVFCYIQNDLVKGLSIQRCIYKVILDPAWRPSQKDAYKDIGFRAMNRLDGMTFSQRLLPNWEMAMNVVGQLSGSCEVTLIAAKVEAFKLANRRLPATLEELKEDLPQDAFAGRSYAYRLERQGQAYTLWGVGRDGKDNGGVPHKDVVVTGGMER